MYNSLHIVLLIKSVPIFFFFLRSLGGMCGAVVTSPFDVVKTRLQSDLFRQKHTDVGAVVGDSVVLVRRPGGFLWHFVETTHIIRYASRPVSISPLPPCGILLIYYTPLRITRTRDILHLGI
jgi:Mitochondrial carrier protein